MTLLTFLLADAFILDNVFMVERLQDFDLAREVGALLLAGLGLQGLDGNQLAGLVSSRVVAAQLHLAEVALKERRSASERAASKCSGKKNPHSGLIGPMQN